jgi:hypothetical protein
MENSFQLSSGQINVKPGTGMIFDKERIITGIKDPIRFNYSR